MNAVTAAAAIHVSLPPLSDLATVQPAHVLETAAGTSVVTRALASTLPPSVTIIATYLNQPMLDFAASHTDADNVTWRQADALKLPFGEGAFDAVVCQFGAMFFPDKVAAYREARRVRSLHSSVMIRSRAEYRPTSSSRAGEPLSGPVRAARCERTF